MTTLQSLRRFLLAILLMGMSGTVVELLLLRHDEDALQFVPLVMLGLGLGTVTWHAIRPGGASATAVRIVMAGFVAAGLTGVFFHFRANLQYQREFDPSLHGRALIWQALQAKVPPALAPGVLLQLGFLGLAYTYRQRGDLT